MENVALAGEARSAVACAESAEHALSTVSRSGTYPEPAGTESNPVGRSGFRVSGQNACKAWVAARDVSDVCALSVHFITASKIKLGPDGIVR